MISQAYIEMAFFEYLWLSVSACVTQWDGHELTYPTMLRL